MNQERKKDQPRFQVSDRRFWVEDPSIDKTATVPKTKYPSFVEELRARTEAAEQRLRERLKALDEENAAFKERVNRQIDKRVREGKAGFLRELLEIVDNFERAIAAAEDSENFEGFLEGVHLNLDLFLNKLSTLGVEPIDNLGCVFDPAEAEALGTVPVSESKQDGVVVQVVQKGYKIDDQVLRPAMVLVGKFQEQGED